MGRKDYASFRLAYITNVRANITALWTVDYQQVTKIVFSIVRVREYCGEVKRREKEYSVFTYLLS